MTRSRRHGFTLVELLVVIAIIAKLWLGFAPLFERAVDVLVFVVRVGLGFVTDSDPAPPRLAAEGCMPNLVVEENQIARLRFDRVTRHFAGENAKVLDGAIGGKIVRHIPVHRCESIQDRVRHDV